MSTNLIAAIERLELADIEVASALEEKAEAERIVRGILHAREIPIARVGDRAYASLADGGVGVTRLRMIEGRAGDQ